MVNKALQDRSQEILEEQKARQEERQSRKERGELTKGMPRILTEQVDVRNYGTPLHKLSQGLDIWFHKLYVQAGSSGNKRFKYVICDKTYARFDPAFSESCSICKERINGRTEKSSQAKAIIFYIFNNVGKKFTPDPENHPEKSYDISAERIVLASYGGGLIMKGLVDDDRKGFFQKALYEIMKTGTGTDTRYKIDKAAREFIDPEVQLDPIPKEILDKYNVSDDEIAQMILCAFEPHNGTGEIKWDVWDVPEPVKKESESAQNEPEKTPTHTVVKGGAKSKLG